MNENIKMTYIQQSTQGMLEQNRSLPCDRRGIRQQNRVAEEIVTLYVTTPVSSPTLTSRTVGSEELW